MPPKVRAAPSGLVLWHFSESAARWRCVLWGALAVANLAYGVWLAREPARSEDVLTVFSWTAAWLLRGVNLYTPEWSVDYPPHAIVALAPIGFISPPVLLWIWVVVNLVLAIGVPVLAIRAMCPQAPKWGRLEVILLFLCWSGTKVLTQYSLLAMAFSLVGLRLADPRPMLSGVAVGLALMKPQVAFPVALWVVLAGRWRTVAVAAAVVVAGWLAFAVRASVSPLAIVTGYLDILQMFYTGRDALDGASHLRPLFERIASPDSADLLSAGVALLMLAIIVGLTRRPRGSDRLMTLALAGAWSLSTFYHLTYGFILLLPATILLRLARPGRGDGPRTLAFWALQAALIVDMPGVARRAAGMPPAILAVLTHADRLLMLAVFASVVWLASVRAEAATGR